MPGGDKCCGEDKAEEPREHNKGMNSHLVSRVSPSDARISLSPSSYLVSGPGVDSGEAKIDIDGDGD